MTAKRRIRNSIATATYTVTALACAALPVCARAADVYFAPRISIAAGHDDNVRLDPDESDGQSRLRVVAEAEIGSRLPDRDAIFKAATHVNRYSDSELDSNDWFLDLDLLRRTRQHELGLLTSYRRASTITTELEDTGDVRDDRRREDWRIAPSWTYKVTRRTETTLTYEFTDVAYEDGTEVRLIDYRDHRVEASITHRLSETASWYGRADYLRFESEDTTDADNVGLLVGLVRDFSPQFRAGLAVGARYTESEFFIAEDTKATDSDSGFNYEAYATWTREKSVLGVRGSRRVEPSGRGNVADVDRVEATWKRSLTRAWELNINGRASRHEFAPTGTQPLEDRKYYNAEVKIGWHGRPRWQFDLAYKYRRQEFDDPQEGETADIGDSADSNEVFLTMRYTWARMSLFR